MTKLFFSKFLQILAFISCIYLGKFEVNLDNSCTEKTTCGVCISKSECAWCTQTNYIKYSRCDRIEFISNSCPDGHVVNPSNSLEIVDEGNPSDMDGSPVQLKPRKISLRVRPNSTIKFKISFDQAVDYPVDLYYLMDLTWSMKEHKQQLADLADLLAESMSNITKNFRLGFGSFIDKVVMPFANMVPEKLINPCMDNSECVPPYGFKNHLPLTRNVSRFVDEVSRASLSGNLDNAEGGFDAIMQVVVCHQEINWDALSRKIIVFTTDSAFHYAGDGKLGGIVKRNDGLCHLDKNGYYTESVHQDYPSLSQIRNATSKNKVNIIFAVPKEVYGLYERLSSHLDGAETGSLGEGSYSIVDLVKVNYKKILSRIKLKDTFPSSLFEVKYYSSCKSKDGKQETNVCEGIGAGDKIEFDVELKALKCSKHGEQKSYSITPVGLNESTEISVNIVCDCDCESPEMADMNSSQCNYGGSLKCGKCECDNKRHGINCECQGDDDVRKTNMELCQRGNETEICSKKGECDCGVCICESGPTGVNKIYGKYCECDSFSCERDEYGRVCGGQGECCDGQCKCPSGWSGPACDCKNDIGLCINVFDGKICSGHGDCVCGKCKCNQHIDRKEYYNGSYCEDCLTCEGKCSDIQPCIECQIFDSGPYSEEECTSLCSLNIIQINDINEVPEDTDNKKCVFLDKDNCQLKFVYSYDEEKDNIKVFVIKTRECPELLNMWTIIAIVAGAVLIIGLILILCVRVFFYLKDRKEYMAWLEEVDKTKMNMSDLNTNPLYKEAITKHDNPLYNKQKT